MGVLKTTKNPDHQLSPEDSSLFETRKILKRSEGFSRDSLKSESCLLKVLSAASMYSLGQWAIWNKGGYCKARGFLWVLRCVSCVKTVVLNRSIGLLRVCIGRIGALIPVRSTTTLGVLNLSATTISLIPPTTISIIPPDGEFELMGFQLSRCSRRARLSIPSI